MVHCEISSIESDMWPAIIKLENEAFTEIAPESLEALKSRCDDSPKTCFVARVDGDVIAFTLAHRWDSLTPPALFKPLPKGCHGSFLFLHDFVVSKQYAGRGVGEQMVVHLVTLARQYQFTKLVLVAVQGSESYWGKRKFDSLALPISASYGDNAVLMQRDIEF